MDEKNTTQNFKFRLDDENPDVLLREERKNQRIDKLNQRITLLAVLLPCLIVVILIGAYVEMRRRVSTNINAGTAVVTTLSKDVTTKLDTVSSNYEALEQNISKKLLAIEKTISSIQNQSNKLQKNISTLQSSKSDKKETANTLKKIETKIAPIQASIDDLKASINTLKSSLANDISSIKDSISTQSVRIKNVQQDISILETEKIDRTILERAIKNENGRYSNILGKLEQDISHLKFKLNKIEASASKPLAGSEADTNQQPNATGSTIIEQNLE